MHRIRVLYTVSWLLPIVFAAAGCLTHSSSSESRTLPFYEAPEGRATAVKAVDGESVLNASVMEAGSSVDGRPIRAYILGEGDKNVLLVGGIHGDEPGGETLLKGLIAFLSKQPELIKEFRAVVVPALNPDGLEYRTRFNSSGVDINLNFPSKDWGVGTAQDKRVIGFSAGSEPETQALMKVLERYPPAIALSIHSAAGCITHEGPGAEEWADRLSESSGLPKEKFRTRPGSLGALLGRDEGIPFLTVELQYHHERGEIAPAEKQRFIEVLMVLFQ